MKTKVIRIKSAFTLAEVLITLGIIGIVAAMTMPTLIQNHRKHVVETRLSKFYTTINQAIQMSETVNGDKKYWDTLGSGFEKDEEDNPDYTKPQALAWFEKYLKPYLQYAGIDVFSNKNVEGIVLVYFNDGSALAFSGSGWSFYPNATKFKTLTDENGLSSIDISVSGRDYFAFYFRPAYNATNYKYHYNKGVEPYMYLWDGKIETLKNHSFLGCKNMEATNERAYCTALIMLNGWKIPKDYPLKF